jgi:BCD family chlorophyll transporter-like MFS transporter
MAFLLAGAGLHTTQTAGLALATDLATPESRPRVVALLYVMLLLGMASSALAFGLLLSDFGQIRLIRVIQGAGVLTMVLNCIALWKQEARDPSRTQYEGARPSFREAWRTFTAEGRVNRFLVTVALGTMAFAMQDVLLEPYGAEILNLTVGATTSLTALLAGGMLVAFMIAARRLSRGGDIYRLAACGVLIGVLAFSAVIFAAPLSSPVLFRIGTALIGLGGGLFSVCTLTAAMELDRGGVTGLALGAWGAIQASAAGLGIAAGGLIRDVASALAQHGDLGPALTDASVGYGVVYHFEIVLLFATLIAIGPLVRIAAPRDVEQENSRFGLAGIPG